MYKIAILGCENTHADGFLNLIKEGKFPELSVSGVYSCEEDAAKKLNEKFGVNVMENYDSLVGQLDGVIITARHGDNHYKYAKPYMNSGIPMFVDKPITCTDNDVRALMSDAKENGVRLTGGSMLALLDDVTEARRRIESGELGEIYGGNVVAPVQSDSVYGGFYFYAEHLMGILIATFGTGVKEVFATKNGTYSLIFRYKDFDVTGTYLDGNYKYSVSVYGKEAIHHAQIKVTSAGFVKELEKFTALLHGGEMTVSYEDMSAPVFIMNAIERSLLSGKWEQVLTL